MIVSCPSCGTRYRVDASSLGEKGRKVRCARCGHDWLATPEASPKPPPAPAAEVAVTAAPPTAAEAVPEPAPEGGFEPPPIAPPGPEIEPEAEAEPKAGVDADVDDATFLRRRPAAPPAPPRRQPSRARWVALVLIVSGVVAGALVAREEIAAAWPPATAFYELVGLPVSQSPVLELRNVRSEKRLEQGVEVLVVEGEVVNLSDQASPTPEVRVTLRDDAEREVATWLVKGIPSKLEPGEAIEFTTRRQEPPADARGLVVSFDGRR